MAIIFTTKFPSWFGAEFDDPPAPTNTEPATLAPTPERTASGAAALHVDPAETLLDQPLAGSEEDGNQVNLHFVQQSGGQILAGGGGTTGERCILSSRGMPGLLECR